MSTIGKSLFILVATITLTFSPSLVQASTSTPNNTKPNESNVLTPEPSETKFSNNSTSGILIENRQASIVNLYRSSNAGDENNGKLDTDVKSIEKCTNVLENSDLINKCVELVNNNWGCLIEAKSSDRKLHQISLTCGTNEPMICCPLWAIIRCILKQAQVNCDDGIVNDYRKYNFQQLIYQLDNSRCRNYTFGSEECVDVFKFVTNQELLEKDAKEKGLYKYFFKFGHSNETSLPVFSRSKTSHAVALSGHIGLIFGLMLFTLVLCSDHHSNHDN